MDSAVISGIGPGRKATLQSYGIETAEDINDQAVLAVPGFGDGLTSRLDLNEVAQIKADLSVL